MPDFESLIDRSADLFTVFESDGVVLYQNAAIERHCGYSQEDLVESSLLDSVHPDDRDRLEPILRRPEQASIDDRIDYRLRHADGSWVWFETTTDPWPDDETGGYVLVAREIEDRVALERQLERYTVILDSLNDAVYAIGSDGTIVYINEAYASLKGVDRDEMLGTDIYRWGENDAIDRIKEAREELAASDRDVGIVEFDFSTIDGRDVPVEMRFSSVTQPDNELERVGVVRDVTERKARERALNRKNERLEAFASIVSHDLRNPLNVASGHLELARELCDDDDDYGDDDDHGDDHDHGDNLDHLAEVASAHDRMETLIENLLTLAREGDAVAETRPINLADAAERSWRGVDTKDATLAVDTDRVVRADGSRLRQLFENLIRNAVEHAEAGVTVTVGDLPDGFYVTDDGPGIPGSERERVFEPGYSTNSEGTGFGLGIVQEIVNAHGWEISVTESESGGARFEITDVEVPG